MILLEPDNAEAPVVGLKERYEPGTVAEHAHQRAQIMFALEGSLTVITADGSWILPPHRALWLPGGMKHQLRLQKPIELCTLYLDESVPWTRPRQLIAVLNVSTLIRELIVAAVHSSWSYSKDSDEARLARVLCDRVSHIHQEPLHLPEPRDQRARRLSVIYHNAPSERRPLSILAHEVGASLRTLERLFITETGLSIGAWTQQLRLMFALERIADGMSIGDAAFSVGFENPSSFIALFKRQFGTTPGQFFK